MNVNSEHECQLCPYWSILSQTAWKPLRMLPGQSCPKVPLQIWKLTWGGISHEFPPQQTTQMHKQEVALLNPRLPQPVYATTRLYPHRAYNEPTCQKSCENAAQLSCPRVPLSKGIETFTLGMTARSVTIRLWLIFLEQKPKN
jgi:hypothetical protein